MSEALVLAVGGGCVVCCLMCVMACHRPTDAGDGGGDAQTALLLAAATRGGGDQIPSSRFTSHRLEAASRDAHEGFNACAYCDFANFKRTPFCNLCGAQIATVGLLATDGGSSSSGVANAGAVTTRGAASGATTQRQRRARLRKEWVRKMDIERTLFWYRDHQLTHSNDTSSTNRVGLGLFPGFTLRFVNNGATSSPEQLANVRHHSDSSSPSRSPVAKIKIEVFPDDEPSPRVTAVATSSSSAASQHQESALTATRNELYNAVSKGEGHQPIQAPLSKAVVIQSLEVEVAFQTLVLESAITADASEMPLPRSKQDAVNTEFAHWRQTLKLAKQEFPLKYAYFVAATAALLVHVSKQYIRLNVLRESVLLDSLESFSVVPRASIRSVIRVNFVVEAGVDAGGLQREWFVLLTQELCEPANGIFTCVSMGEQIFYLNPNSLYDIGEDHLMYYYATGRLIGRSLLEGQVLNFHLALPLLKIILGIPVSLSDLEYFDPKAFKSLMWIMKNDGVGDLGITFSVMENHGDKAVEIDLIENGRHVDVTDENKELYLERKFRYLLFESVSSQLFVFLKGLYEVIPQELLMVFDPEELDFVLCGSDEIDVDDWQKHTRINASLENHKALRWFWEFVREMPTEYRRRLLHFATGSSRVPLGGFAALTSLDGRICPFMLKGVPLEENEYIASRACFNRLDVPLYDSRVKMGTVLFAILDTELHGFTTD